MTKAKKTTKKAVKKKATKKKPPLLAAYILLDRSGSMQAKWDETLSSVNAYVDALKSGVVTVAAFDDYTGFQFDIVRDAVDTDKFKSLSTNELKPRGGTPLYDAMSKIVSTAEQAGNDKTIIIVMTDGYENASKEVDQNSAKALVERCKKKGWEVIFLGADFDTMAQSAGIGVMAGKTLNMTRGNYTDAMGILASASISYTTGDLGSKGIQFSAKDRAVATKKQGN